jgi:hypothetical protein
MKLDKNIAMAAACYERDIHTNLEKRTMAYHRIFVARSTYWFIENITSSIAMYINYHINLKTDYET